MAGCASAGEVRASPQTPTAGLTGEQVSSIAAQADSLYGANRWREALDFLSKYSSCEEAEIQWRLARLCYKVGLLLPSPRPHAPYSGYAADVTVGYFTIFFPFHNIFPSHEWQKSGRFY